VLTKEITQNGSSGIDCVFLHIGINEGLGKDYPCIEFKQQSSQTPYIQCTEFLLRRNKILPLLCNNFRPSIQISNPARSGPSTMRGRPIVDDMCVVGVEADEDVLRVEVSVPEFSRMEILDC
jgi:hypothetical protein